MKLLLILIGAFIGWNFPQPAYAKMIQDWVVAKWNAITKKTSA